MEKKNLTQKEALEMLSQLDLACHQQNLVGFSRKGDANKVELLLIGGLNPDEEYIDKDKNKFIPIIEAIKNNNSEIIELLLLYNANINLLFKGDPILIYSIKKGKTKAAMTLIENGADINLMNAFKVNALYVAAKNNNSEIIQLLKSKGAHEMNEEEIKNHDKKKWFYRLKIAGVALGVILLVKTCSDGSESTSSGSGGGGGGSTPNSNSSATYDCPHCNGSGQRPNSQTGAYGKCNSCGGDGSVTQSQYDHLSK